MHRHEKKKIRDRYRKSNENRGYFLLSMSIILLLASAMCATSVGAQTVKGLLSGHATNRQNQPTPSPDAKGTPGQLCALSIEVDPPHPTGGQGVIISVLVPSIFSSKITSVLVTVGGSNFELAPISPTVWTRGMHNVPEQPQKLSFLAHAYQNNEVLCIGSTTVEVNKPMSVKCYGPAYLEKGKEGIYYARVKGGKPPYDYTFQWDDFSEDNTVEQTTAVSVGFPHTFNTDDYLEGCYIIVKDSRGVKASCSILIDIIHPLRVQISGPDTIIKGENRVYKFSVDGGYDPKQLQIFIAGISYSHRNLYESDSWLISHRFDEAGPQEIEAEVTDFRGNTASASKTVEVLEGEGYPNVYVSVRLSYNIICNSALGIAAVKDSLSGFGRTEEEGFIPKGKVFFDIDIERLGVAAVVLPQEAGKYFIVAWIDAMTGCYPEIPDPIPFTVTCEKRRYRMEDDRIVWSPTTLTDTVSGTIGVHTGGTFPIDGAWGYTPNVTTITIEEGEVPPN